MSRNLPENEYQDRKTWTVIVELMEAQMEKSKS